MCKKEKGFTLSELMVTIIIVLVLAGIGIPIYIGYVREGRKADAYAVIDEIVLGAVEYYKVFHTFEEGSISAFAASDEVEEAEYFSYTLSELSDTGFVVTATEKGNWAKNGASIQWVHTGVNYVSVGQYNEEGW